jgi:hypothetical protein
MASRAVPKTKRLQRCFGEGVHYALGSFLTGTFFTRSSSSASRGRTFSGAIR